ncbi:MAG: leucyl aminopeptidase [Myxococcota bacterium]|nr:leucyl aminopeptidase [Myxococcota bacterium]
MQINLSAESNLSAAADAVALFVSSNSPSTLPSSVEPALAEAIQNVLAEEKFDGKAGALVSIRPLGALPSKWCLIVGAGSGFPNDLRRAAGECAHFARGQGAETLNIVVGDSLSDGAPSAQTRALVEGLFEGNYQFDKYKPEDKKKAALREVTVTGLSGDAADVERGSAFAHGQTVARNLVNEPAEVVYPESLAAFCEDLRSDQMTVEIWDEARCREEGMGGIIGVGQGSARPPRFIHMSWTPKGESKGHIGLVGKGITFDAGGLSIKPSSGMQTMRCDMGGSAVVVGIMSALDKVQPNVKVEGLIGAAENMLGGYAFKLGDVLTMRNGKTVEIHNTDAEGRLVLADCLSYASELGVDECIDFATLTGAAVVALGERYSALFTEHDDFADIFLDHAATSGEGLWRLPLEMKYKEKLKAEWAQIKNVGGREAGSITAALFLSEFVDGPTWAHFDIAGPTFVSAKTDHFRKGATGAMVRTVLNWLESK